MFTKDSPFMLSSTRAVPLIVQNMLFNEAGMKSASRILYGGSRD